MAVSAEQHRSANLNKYTTGNKLYRWHMETFHDHVAGLVSGLNPSSLLDVGCGEGFLAANLHSRMPGVAISGVDASEGAITFARSEFGDAAVFETGDIFDLRFADNAIDVVLYSEVLEHLHDPASAIREMMRVAKVGLVLTVPLEPYFKFFNDIARALRISPDPEHVQFWRHDAWKRFVSGICPNATFTTLHYYQTAVCRLA